MIHDLSVMHAHSPLCTLKSNMQRSRNAEELDFDILRPRKDRARDGGKKIQEISQQSTHGMHDMQVKSIARSQSDASNFMQEETNQMR